MMQERWRGMLWLVAFDDMDDDLPNDVDDDDAWCQQDDASMDEYAMAWNGVAICVATHGFEFSSLNSSSYFSLPKLEFWMAVVTRIFTDGGCVS